MFDSVSLTSSGPLFYAVALAVIFLGWHRTEGTLSIHIYTTRRELFYWATVLATFALGTAASDLTAYTLHLGLHGIRNPVRGGDRDPCSRVLYPGLQRANVVWFAYVITRPLGLLRRLAGCAPESQWP